MTRTYDEKCKKYMFIGFVLPFLATFIIQIWLWTTDDPIYAGYVSIATVVMGCMLVFSLFCAPKRTHIEFDKANDSIEATYFVVCCGMRWVQKGKISQVRDIKLETIKSQYGIVGYSIKIIFKNKVRPIVIWQELSDNVMENIEELTQFCMSKSTDEVQETQSCDCRPGGCHCVCCPNYIAKAFLMFLFGAIFILVSFLISNTMYPIFIAPEVGEMCYVVDSYKEWDLGSNGDCRDEFALDVVSDDYYSNWGR